MSNDFHKRIAKDALWDRDGHHTPKRYRETGSARESDKILVRAELEELRDDVGDDLVDELDLAVYCYRYGPCEQCKEKMDKEKKV